MEHVNEWRAVAAATGPADRAAAEAAVRRAYRSAGLAEPERFVWAGSPAAAVGIVRALDDPGRNVREEVRTRPWAAERRRVHDELGPQGWSELWQATGGQLWDGTRMLTERIRAGVVEALVGTGPEDHEGTGPEDHEGTAPEDHEGTAPEDRKNRRAAEQEVRGVLLDAVHGQHDAPWLAAFEGSAVLAGLADVARNAGWWWPFERVVVLCERPERLLRDEAGRLHAADGPAVVFPDGFALHAWSGMPVPATLFAELNSLTVERIRDEDNAELRRVMLEFFGYERYLSESGATHVHRDETGILWRIPLFDDEDIVMVEVVNSTPEPDGTHRTYWLRVPPGTRTAKEGVAWTFGLDADEYEPLRQT